jgi:hypothetical protein
MSCVQCMLLLTHVVCFATLFWNMMVHCALYRAAWIENTSAATALPAVATAVYTLSHKAAKLMSQVTNSIHF